MKNKNLSNVVKIAAVCAVAVGILAGVPIWSKVDTQEATALNSAGVTEINGNGHIVDEAAKDGFVEEFKYGAKLGEFKNGSVENNMPEQIPMGEVKDAPVENGWGYVLTEGKENEYVQELATGENEKLAEELKDDRISDVDAVGDGVGQEKVPKIPGTRSETTEIVYDINELHDANELIAPEPTKADNTPYLIGGGVLVAVLLGGGYAIYRSKRQNPEQK